MITYTFDDSSTYTDDILHILRAHNQQFTGNKDRETFHIYIVDNDILMAAATINYNWDWVSFSNLFYLNISGLKDILLVLSKRYKAKAAGIKLFTNDKDRYNDFITVGFEPSGKYTEEPSQITWYYANFYRFDIQFDVTYNSITGVEPIDTYDTILKAHVDQHNKKHNIKDKLSSFNIVAIDNDICIGGVTCDVYDAMIYIPYLAVDNTYRKKGIGSHLMTQVENEAKRRNLKMIDLGTSDFQAKGFYEKLGYKAVYTQKNQPRGYNTYTMIKLLK